MTTIRRVSRVLWGLLYVYCLVLCSILLIIIFVVLFAPFRIIHPRYERQLQELTQWVWVYLLLGITASAADSKMLITLPEDCGLEEEARVLELLRDRFVFDPEILARFAKLKQQGKRGAEGKRSIIIANHQLYLDWIYIWALMAKLRREGTVKIILKRSLLNIPVFGVGMKLLNFIFLHRNWELDRHKFGRRLEGLVYEDLPFSLVIFPEGTTLSEDAVEKSTRFAEAHGLAVPVHTLVPRVTGMQFALNTLGRHICGVFDLTIGYSGTRTDEFPEDTFGLMSLFFDGVAPQLIHFYVRFHPIEKIPYQDPQAFAQWMYSLYQEKEQLMARFYREGRFPGSTSRLLRASSNYAMPLIALGSIFTSVMLLCIAAALYHLAVH